MPQENPLGSVSFNRRLTVVEHAVINLDNAREGHAALLSKQQKVNDEIKSTFDTIAGAWDEQTAFNKRFYTELKGFRTELETLKEGSKALREDMIQGFARIEQLLCAKFA
jgi:hypothetical protein